MTPEFKKAALEYHSSPRPGKIEINVTKPCDTQYDLAMAYTPGVAEPVREIAKNPSAAYIYTAKSNLVGVVTDGSAVLGLGSVGALAGKPVMEGKAVLFKRFADIDVFDIEINAETPEEFISTVVNIAPTFGGINLEDIASPHCFEIEQALVNRLDIPVFHDDQHGTAIIVAAGLLNALDLQNKKLKEVKIVCLGAGAAGLASMRLLVDLGAQKSNIFMVDRKGIIRTSRHDLGPYKFAFAVDTNHATLEEAMVGADVFVGVSGPNMVTPRMIRSMADRPVVFALSNPDPEIRPEEAYEQRSDIIMATGRSDYPNQVNNVLGFPFIFRGALDVYAQHINTEMHFAAVNALRLLAQQPVPKEVLKAYRKDHLEFGSNYIIPTPLDPRLKDYVSTAVAWAAVKTGVARRAYPDHYPKVAQELQVPLLS